MGLLDSWRYFLRGPAAQPDLPSPREVARSLADAPPVASGKRVSLPQTSNVIISETAKALAGGRQLGSINSNQLPLTQGTLAVIPPPDFESDWRLDDLDTATFDARTPFQLLQLLAGLSPDISRALWDFLRLTNPGWELRVYRKGTREEFRRGRVLLGEFLGRLEDAYGAFDVVIGRLFISAFLRGAFLAELVLDADARTPVDLAVPDPGIIRFASDVDPIRGDIWRMGQWERNGTFTYLERPTIRYIPVDPFPDSPYGRALAEPALFPTLFLLGLLHDLRRVISQQGYPRLDIAVKLEGLLKSMPAADQGDTKKFKEWVAAVVKEVKDAYAQLKPDDVYIHTDVVTVNRPVGAVDSNSLSAVDGLIKMLERMAARALKTMPLLMGSPDSGASETHANRQWEIMAAGVKSLQHFCETMLGRLFVLALQAQGVQADVEIRFAELRAAELMRDAQTEQIVIDNWIRKIVFGWVSQKEASLAVTGHDPEESKPLAWPSTLKPTAGTGVSTLTGVAPNSDGTEKADGQDGQSDPNPNDPTAVANNAKKAAADAAKTRGNGHSKKLAGAFAAGQLAPIGDEK